MLRFWLSLSLAYAFLWRFILVASIQSIAQYNYINSKGLYLKKDTGHLLIYLLVICFFVVWPFFVTMYWMLVGGALYRITSKYSPDYVPKRYMRSLFLALYNSLASWVIYALALVQRIVKKP